MEQLKKIVAPYRASVEKLLHEQDSKVNKFLALAESKTGMKRFYIVSGIAAILGLYLVIGYGAQLLCNGIGFLYPAYASIKALESQNKDDDTKWLTYWVVYAFFSVAEFFSDMLLSWFPFYWLAKCVFLIWCFAPVSWNGSQWIYSSFIRPVFIKHQVGLDTAISGAAEKLGEVAGKAVNKAQQIAAEAVLKKD